MTWWRVQAALFLPLPLVLLTVLSTPAPRDVRHKVLWFTEKVLGWEVRRPFQVMHFALLVTGATMLMCVAPMLQAQHDLSAGVGVRDPNTLVLLASQKFRRERNFWISLYTFTAWVVLHIVHKVNKEKHELRGHLLALQGRASEAAREVTFMGSGAEAEMCRVGMAAAGGPLGQSVSRLVPLSVEVGAPAGPAADKKIA